MMIAELFAKLGIKPDKRSFDAADKMIGAVKTALVGLAAFAATKFLGGMVQDTIALGGELNDLSVQTNTNVEELQELGYAAQQNGGSLELMGNTLTKLNKNISEAAHGNKEMAKSFARAGIAVKGADGALRPASDVLGDIADHLAAIPAEERVGVAMDLLGKSGAKLIPTLAQGSAGLAKLKQEARDLGGVITEDGITALDDMGDEVDKVKFALTGIRNEAVIALLPALKEMVGSLLAWVKANRKVIAQKLAALIKIIAKGFLIAGKVVGFVVDALEFLGEHIDLVAVAFISLVAAIAIFKAASIAAAIASGVAWLLANLPLVLLAVAVAAVILLVEDLYTWFMGGDSVLKELWQSFKTWFGEKITKIIEDNVEFWKLIFNTIFEWIQKKIEWLWNKAKAVKDWITGDDDPIKKEYVAAMMNYQNKSAYGSPEERAAAKKRFDDAKYQMDNHEGAVPSLDLSSNATPNQGPAQITAPVTIQVTGASSPEETARVVKATLGTWWGDQLRGASTGVGGVK